MRKAKVAKWQGQHDKEPKSQNLGWAGQGHVHPKFANNGGAMKL